MTPEPGPGRREAPSEVSLAVAGELRVLISRLGRRTRAATGEMTPSQFSALLNLDEAGALRLHELAAREGVAPPTMSRVIDGLVAADLVSRERDTNDARSSFISVTVQGKSAIDRFTDSRSRLLAAHLDGLGEEHRAAISAALPGIRALVDSFSVVLQPVPQSVPQPVQ
jgi:DNA-binding MarR family transcriptional regulator